VGNGKWGMSLSFKRQIHHIGGVIAMEISKQVWGRGRGVENGNWEWGMGSGEWGMGNGEFH